MPAASQRARSSADAAAVSAMMGGAAAPDGLDLARGLQAVDVGHVHVHQDGAQALAGRRGLATLPPPPAVAGGAHFVAQLQQHRAGDLEVDRVVVGHQHGDVLLGLRASGRWPLALLAAGCAGASRTAGSAAQA
jgi:hypothetical protein